MNVPKKRKANKMEDVSGEESRKTEIDPSATIISPRKPIRSYSNSLDSYCSSRSPDQVRLFSFLTRLSIYYTLKPRLSSRLIVYGLLILLLGLFRDYVLLENLLPKSIEDILYRFSIGKRSWINLYTVKIGWFWTLVSLVPFMLFTRYDMAKRNRTPNNPRVQFFSRFFPCIIRLMAMTLIWYYSVEFFVFYADKDGKCENNTPTNQTEVLFFDRHKCRKHGHKWIPGFDISGHIFLMIFSNLVRFEEFKHLIKYFDEFSEFRYMKLPKDRVQNYCSPYGFVWSMFYIRTLIYLMIFFIVTVCWDFMIVQTSIFYHSLPQKIIAYSWAVFSWFVLYKLIYPRLNLSV